ncbi:hypothetical protein TcWFU_007444 [Taenia crassiceps]|uniref:Uncharacterized protein n=1 Tax=Taenia crassiceps TaxID=6207 RepID=A0ABR4QS86_9CEST
MEADRDGAAFFFASWARGHARVARALVPARTCGCASLPPVVAVLITTNHTRRRLQGLQRANPSLPLLDPLSSPEELLARRHSRFIYSYPNI